MPERTIKTLFFYYRQTNSGGSVFVSEKKGIGHVVWIEAIDEKDADARAEEIGIYFDGCSSGRDCNCCGDRWSRARLDESVDESDKIQKDHVSSFIHFWDRSFEKNTKGL